MNSDMQALKSFVFVYLGPNWKRFVEVFGAIGRIRIRSAFLPEFVAEQSCQMCEDEKRGKGISLHSPLCI